MTDAAERLSQSGLARMLGVKRQAVHDLIKRGIVAAGDDGLIDVASATEAMAMTLRADSKTVASIMHTPPEYSNDQNIPTLEPQESPPTDPVDATSYHVARTLRETAEARMAQLRLRVMANQLVEVSRVRLVVTKLAAMARSAFEKIPDKVSERVAASSDAQECHALLCAEIDLVLADLAAGARSIRLDADDGRN